MTPTPEENRDAADVAAFLAAGGTFVVSAAEDVLYVTARTGGEGATRAGAACAGFDAADLPRAVAALLAPAVRERGRRGREAG